MTISNWSSKKAVISLTSFARVIIEKLHFKETSLVDISISRGRKLKSCNTLTVYSVYLNYVIHFFVDLKKITRIIIAIADYLPPELFKVWLITTCNSFNILSFSKVPPAMAS